MIELISNLATWFDLRKDLRGSIGFVPTMGALHKGHLSLIERCVHENDISIVSIFVNPTQFDNPVDLSSYPMTFDRDMGILNDCNVNFLFHPDYNSLYPDDYKYKVTENDYSKKLEGAYREGHFDGVLSVVMKLLNIIKADRAYFGEKDYQQYKLIDGMTKAYFIDTEIVPCPTMREEDGLAYSSRNRRLTKEERERAALFPTLLKSGETPLKIINELEENGFKVEYIEDIDGRRYGAAHLGKVRLIDNVKL